MNISKQTKTSSKYLHLKNRLLIKCAWTNHVWNWIPFITELVPAKHLLILEKTSQHLSFQVFLTYAKKNKTWQIISEARTWTSEKDELVCKANYLGVRRGGTWQSEWFCHSLSITRLLIKFSRGHLNSVITPHCIMV